MKGFNEQDRVLIENDHYLKHLEGMNVVEKGYLLKIFNAKPPKNMHDRWLAVYEAELKFNMEGYNDK